MADNRYSGRTCMASVVYGTYGRFIPFYIYSVLKSYPDYFVKVFVQGQLSSGERRAVDLLREGGYTNFTITEDYRTDLEWGVGLRWMLPETEFKEFDYLYVGDIDFLIIREDPALHEGHLDHCERRGLPYSNEPRPGTERLTGTQFMKVREYYAGIGPLIAEYQNDRELLVSFVQQLRDNDEWFVYHLAERAFDTPPTVEGDYYRPSHGFHLGHTRARDLKRLEWYVAEILPEAAAGVDVPDMIEQIASCFADPLFRKMLVQVPEPGVLMLPKALGFRVYSPEILVARTRLFLLEVPIHINRRKPKAIRAIKIAIDRFKRGVVRVLRALRLKPPAPDSEREK